MSYRSESVAVVLPRINNTYFLPALQREFVWTSEQICTLFDSVMRRYPVSSFLLWQPPPEARDDVEAYEFLSAVQESRNRARLTRIPANRDVTFVLDGQQRLTAFLVGLQGNYQERKAKSGKGARTYVAKRLYLDLLHDGTAPDAEGDVYHHFEFFDYAPSLLQRNSYWFEVGRILRVVSASDVEQLIERQTKAIRDIRPLTTNQAAIVGHNVHRLYESVWVDEPISYHTETDPDPERILEIFIRANSGGTKLDKSDLLLSTLTLYWRSENAREEINAFLVDLNTKLTRKNDLDKDFIMKSCLALLNLPIAYRVTSFNKDTCTRIRDRWEDIQSALRRAVDAANAFGIDENNLTSSNALIPLAFYLFQNPQFTLRGESAREVQNAGRSRVWLLSALLNRVLSGSSDSMLTRLREVLQLQGSPAGDFPLAQLDEAVRSAGRISASSQDSVENILSTSYGDDTCFLALSLLYDERNWGTIDYQIDHLFARDQFKSRNIREELRELRDDFANLALVIGAENAGKQDVPLDEWLKTRSAEYLRRHFIPSDSALWHFERFEDFLVERRKLLRTRLQQVFSCDTTIVQPAR
jgi:Protein of unknown function DUF262